MSDTSRHAAARLEYLPHFVECQKRRFANEVLMPSTSSISPAFCLSSASQADDDIYVMINAYWEELHSRIEWPRDPLLYWSELELKR
jgi:hypothetical protein